MALKGDMFLSGRFGGFLSGFGWFEVVFFFFFMALR